MAAGDLYARQLALIKAARSLEQDTSRGFDDKINDLWHLLTAAKGSKSCAAEETILRWLLKHMDGTTEVAEQLRRYPLTWAVLGCLFERIALFSLSKIFIERKFIAVLHQSVKDISRPRKNDKDPKRVNGDVTARKRKREEPANFDLDTLRSADALVDSATELFGALHILLSRLETTQSLGDHEIAIGAEHVKSLFRTPAKDAQELVAPLLWTCARCLDALEIGLGDEQQLWVKSATAIWDLRLRGVTDSTDFATFLYSPVCATLIKLRNLEGAKQISGQEWTRQLERLLMKNLMNPVRTLFTNNNTLEILGVANETAVYNAGQSVQLLWALSVQTQRNHDDPASKRAHQLWAQSVFKSLLAYAREKQVARAVISTMLDIAVKANCSPDLITLRSVYHDYCFYDNRSDWALVASIMQCDPDVFLLDEEIMASLFTRAATAESDNMVDRDIIVDRVINPLMNAFANARDLIGFVKKWFNQLTQISNVADDAALNQAALLDPRVRARFAELLQGALSAKQVASLLEWIDEQSRAHGLNLVILEALCDGIADEEYIVVVNSRCFSSAFRKAQDPLPITLAALKWKIASKTVSFVSSDVIHSMWKTTKKELARCLKKGALSDNSTFEAFNYCCRICLSNFPGGDELDELETLACVFIQRLIKEFDTNTYTSTLSKYLEVALSSLSRLGEIASGSEVAEKLSELCLRYESYIRTGNACQISQPVMDLLQKQGVDTESLIDTLTEMFLSKLDDSSAGQCNWTQPQSLSTISSLLDIPSEFFTKDRRKRIMISWKKWLKEINEKVSAEVDYASVVLRLLIQVLRQPTSFTETPLKDFLAFSTAAFRNSSNTVQLIEKLAELMVNSMDKSPGYSREVEDFLKDLDPDQQSQASVSIIALKYIANGLKGTSVGKSPKPIIDERSVVEKLRAVVEGVLSHCASRIKHGRVLTDEPDEVLRLEIALSAAESINNDITAHPVKIKSSARGRLQTASESLASQGIRAGWKLKTFLVTNSKTVDPDALIGLLDQDIKTSPDEQLVFEFADAATRGLDVSSKLLLLYRILSGLRASSGRDVPYLAMERIINTLQVSTPTSAIIEGGKEFDLAALQVGLAQMLPAARSLEQFKSIAQLMLLLLEKHASSMTQVNIEMTISSITEVCSPAGPDWDKAVPAGEVFEVLYRLTAAIIKRHRLRLEGHHHLLVSILQVLLHVLLADPLSKQVSTTSTLPPWLSARLKPRHAGRFARLLTLVCEPSAASVVRGANKPALDSAVDAVKRSAGQHMFRVVMLYIKLQLEATVSREVRKELEAGMFSVLSITPETTLRILNESLDASGRAIFRRIWADYRKFGKWSGV
ncbi:Urb2/Npa2 family-domain-containing protein [Xylariales sp. PMI_506]|nr:Urb2/Npa2 family-domain-containing protein [Xylariales sp. PMI_506]